MSNRNSLRESINKIGDKTTIKLPIFVEKNQPQLDAENWKMEWINEYTRSRKESNDKINHLKLVIKKQAKRIGMLKKKIKRTKNRFVDVGVNTEDGPASIDELRAQKFISTTNLLGASSTSTIPINPFSVIVNSQSDPVFGCDAVFYNKLPTTANSLAQINTIFGQLSNAAQSSQAISFVSGVQPSDNQSKADTDQQSDKFENELGMLRTFSLFNA